MPCCRTAVEVTVTALRGPVDPHTWLESGASNPRERVGKYSLALNQRIRITEVDRFGFQPVTVAVVSPHQVAAPRPAVVSKVPSLDVQITDEDVMGVMGLKFAIHNVSNRTATAFSIGVTWPDGRSGTSHEVSIRPGATFQTEYSLPPAGRRTDAGFVADPNPPTVYLEAALFEQDTFEGDPEITAQMHAGRTGRLIQKRRTAEIAKAVFANNELDDAAKISRLAEEIAKLPQKPDSDMIDAEMGRFSGVRLLDRALIAHHLELGLSGGKRIALSACRQLEGLKPERTGKSLLEIWTLLMEP